MVGCDSESMVKVIATGAFVCTQQHRNPGVVARHTPHGKATSKPSLNAAMPSPQGFVAAPAPPLHTQSRGTLSRVRGPDQLGMQRDRNGRRGALQGRRTPSPAGDLAVPALQPFSAFCVFVSSFSTFLPPEPAVFGTFKSPPPLHSIPTAAARLRRGVFGGLATLACTTAASSRSPGFAPGTSFTFAADMCAPGARVRAPAVCKLALSSRDA